MKILAIDTSSQNASVAITQNQEKLIEINNDDEKTHSQKLMPMIDEAFKKTKTSLNDIELIVCCLGPGSFTGVRIGIATAKAFSDSRNIPTVGINSLEELAYNLKKQGYICSLIDAGHGNAYVGIFKIEKDQNGDLQTVKEDLTFLNLQNEKGEFLEEKLIKFIEKSIKEDLKEQTIYFVGNANIAYKGIIEKLKIKNPCKIEIADDNQNISSGITLAQIGYTKYKNGEYGNSSILSPIYLRKSQAELALEQKSKGEI